MFGQISYKGKWIKVKSSLPPRVKKYVLAHEIYHGKDKQEWGGRLGGEIRATVCCGTEDPLGMFHTLWAGILETRFENPFKKIVRFFRCCVFE